MSLVRVGIVGTGLMGTSIALALRECGVAAKGFDASPEALAEAAERAGVEPAGSIEDASSGAEVVAVCVPIGGVAAAARSALSAGAGVVTDVASVKASVVAALGEEPGFVPGHPIAGAEGSGPRAARADLFRGAAWCLTPTAATDAAAIGRVEEMVTLLGARPLRVDARDHDRQVAMTSHLPQALASSLAAAAAARVGHAAMRGPGFRDMTRLAASDPSLWAGILLANREEILTAAREHRAVLDELLRALERNDPRLVEDFLRRAGASPTDP